jgi:hypothetical protein
MDLPRARKEDVMGGMSTLITLFYQSNIMVTPTTPGCNDNLVVGMIEFETSFNFTTYSMYSNKILHQSYDQLGIGDPYVDVLVFNKLNGSKTRLAYDRKVDCSSLLAGTLSSLQHHWDIETYFGAKTLWIIHPPDKDPRIPGIPDDNVNVLLYLLLGGYGING